MSGTFDNNSPQYFVRHWRAVPEADENALEDFLSWLEYDGNSPDISTDELHLVKALVDTYLGRDKMNKVQQGEYEMLKKWREAAG